MGICAETAGNFGLFGQLINIKVHVSTANSIVYVWFNLQLNKERRAKEY